MSLLPLSEASILRAIELNGAAIESNRQSFRWGRLAAVDPARSYLVGQRPARRAGKKLQYGRAP